MTLKKLILSILLFFASTSAFAQLSATCATQVAPQRCEIIQQGHLSCSDVSAANLNTCLATYTPDLSCKRHRQAEKCRSLQTAQTQCATLQGESRRACVNKYLQEVPKPTGFFK